MFFHKSPAIVHALKRDFLKYENSVYHCQMLLQTWRKFHFRWNSYLSNRRFEEEYSLCEVGFISRSISFLYIYIYIINVENSIIYTKTYKFIKLCFYWVHFILIYVITTYASIPNLILLIWTPLVYTRHCPPYFPFITAIHATRISAVDLLTV